VPKQKQIKKHEKSRKAAWEIAAPLLHLEIGCVPVRMVNAGCAGDGKPEVNDKGPHDRPLSSTGTGGKYY